jgi:hypothetical protein
MRGPANLRLHQRLPLFEKCFDVDSSDVDVFESVQGNRYFFGTDSCQARFIVGTVASGLRMICNCVA